MAIINNIVGINNFNRTDRDKPDSPLSMKKKKKKKKKKNFSGFIRTAARVTLFTKRCRFGAFIMFIDSRSLSSAR